MKRMISLVVAGLLLMALTSCEPEPQFATVQFWLTDAPGDFESVRIEVSDVLVHREIGDQSSGWLSTNEKPALYDLLTLTNGNEALLGSLQLPEGRIEQMRLVLSSRNSVVVDGETYALKVPGGMQSGIKLQLHQDIRPGVTYRVLLDFDVAQSVVDHGNGSYSLKPVIRVITRPEGGSIEGRVDPPSSTPAVYAVAGTDTVASAFCNEHGKFLIRNLPEGTYTVGVVPNSDFGAVIRTGINVQAGQPANVGVIAVTN